MRHTRLTGSFCCPVDTVDHDILLVRLEHRFGITGKALSWLTFYLTDRNQFVKVGNEHSTSRKLLYGVRQGSVLGPILYSMYTAPLEDIIRQLGAFHFWADDKKIYLSFNPKAKGEPMRSLSRVQSCISILAKVRFLLGGGGRGVGRGILEFFGEKRRGPPTSWNGFNACLFRNTQTKTSDPPPPHLSKTKINGSENNKLEVLII